MSCISVTYPGKPFFWCYVLYPCNLSQKTFLLGLGPHRKVFFNRGAEHLSILSYPSRPPEAHGMQGDRFHPKPPLLQETHPISLWGNIVGLEHVHSLRSTSLRCSILLLRLLLTRCRLSLKTVVHHAFFDSYFGYRLPAPHLSPTRISLSTAINPATGVLQVLYLSLTRLSPLHRYPFGARCIDCFLHLTDAFCLSLMRISLSTGIHSAAGALTVLYLSWTRISPFERLQVRCMLSATLRHASPLSITIRGARCFACSPPLSDAPFLFPPLSVRLQGHYTLSTSRTCISPFHGYLPAYRCVARSPPLSDAHVPFPALSIQLQVRCTLSTSP